MISQFEAAGLSFVGRDESGRRMEVSTYKSSTAYLYQNPDFLCLAFVLIVLLYNVFSPAGYEHLYVGCTDC